MPWTALGRSPVILPSSRVRGQELEARLVVAERTIAMQYRLHTQEDLPPDVAMYDDLTNLLNRQAIYEHSLAEVSRAQREKRPVCLVMIEIHNAGKIEEEHGIEMWRQAVRFVARAIRANLRMYDLVGRWMDAKFLVVLPSLAPEHGQSVIERIVTAVHAVNLRLDDGSLLGLDVAGGYTYASPDAHRPLYEQIDHANQALCQAANLETKPRVVEYTED